MAGVLNHAVFMVNVTGVMIILTVLFGRRYVLDKQDRNGFYLAAIAIVCANLAFVSLFAVYFPARMLATDGARYFFEIQQIAAAPWEWNPFTGEGPGYARTAKMGMSYLYGVILFVHQIDTLVGVFALNIVFALLMGLAVFLLARQLSDSTSVAIAAMLITSIFPETMFWTALVARENVALFLLPAFVYLCLRMYEAFRLRHLVLAGVLVLAMVLVRAQLALFPFLVLGYMVIAMLRGSARRTQALAVISIGGVLLYLAYPIIEMQIARAIGRGFVTSYLSLDLQFWLTQWEPLMRNIGRLLTPVARGSYGPAGLLIAPFALAGAAILAWTMFRFRAVFGDRALAAGLLLFLAIVFLAMLAVVGAINIRFRSTVAPLLIPVLTVSAYEIWRRARMPTFRWYGPPRQESVPVDGPLPDLARGR